MSCGQKSCRSTLLRIQKSNKWCVKSWFHFLIKPKNHLLYTAEKLKNYLQKNSSDCIYSNLQPRSWIRILVTKIITAYVGLPKFELTMSLLLNTIFIYFSCWLQVLIKWFPKNSQNSLCFADTKILCCHPLNIYVYRMTIPKNLIRMNLFILQFSLFWCKSKHRMRLYWISAYSGSKSVD